MTWAEHHSASERFATSGELAFRKGDIDTALELYRRAAEAEMKALDALPIDKRRTLGITATSAVALWHKAREYKKAAQLAHKWLGDESLPEFELIN